jgi:FKBP-type peptidyl-prolyl cis-trans isomerase (trigger factor)
VPGELVRQELLADGLEESAVGSEAWVAAVDRTRLLVILKRIARQEGIEVDERDVQQRLAEKAEELGTTKKDLQAEFEKGGV